MRLEQAPSQVGDRHAPGIGSAPPLQPQCATGWSARPEDLRRTQQSSTSKNGFLGAYLQGGTVLPCCERCCPTPQPSQTHQGQKPGAKGSRSLHCSCVGCCSEWGRCFAPRAGVGPGAEAMPADWRGRRHRTLRPPCINNGHLNCFVAKQHLQQCAPVTAVCKRGLWMCCSVRRGASGASSSLSFPCMLDFSCMLEFTFGSLPLETTQRARPTRAGQTRE